MKYLGKLFAALLLAGGLSGGAVQASPSCPPLPEEEADEPRPQLVERRRPERPHWDNRYHGDRRRHRPPYHYAPPPPPPPPYPGAPYGFGPYPYAPNYPFGYDPRRPLPNYPFGYDPRRPAPRYDDYDPYGRRPPHWSNDRRNWKPHRRPVPPPPPPPPAWPGFNGWI